MSSFFKRPFVSVVRTILIFMLVLSLILIGQQLSYTVYQIGLSLLVVSTISQIPFGNIPPNSSFKRSMVLFGIGLSIIIAVFGIGILAVPSLLRLGQG